LETEDLIFRETNVTSTLSSAYKAASTVDTYSSIVKVKESRNRPDVAQRVPGVLGSQIS
jgi:hypothetical protein